MNKKEVLILLFCVFLISSKNQSQYNFLDDLHEKMLILDRKLSDEITWIQKLIPHTQPPKCPLNIHNHSQFLKESLTCKINDTLWIEAQLKKHKDNPKVIKEKNEFPESFYTYANLREDLVKLLSVLKTQKTAQTLSTLKEDPIHLYSPVMSHHLSILIQGRLSQPDWKQRMKAQPENIELIWNSLWPHAKKPIRPILKFLLQGNYTHEFDTQLLAWLREHPRVNYINKSNIKVIKRPEIKWFGPIFEMRLEPDIHYTPIYKTDEGYVMSKENYLTLRFCHNHNCISSQEKTVDYKKIVITLGVK